MNAGIPKTRQSLLIRVQDANDGRAWNEFEGIYRPAVYRFARRRRLQPADAEDVTQQVFVAIAKKIPQWKMDRSRGSFRAWLLMVARNAVANQLGRRPCDAACGGTAGAIELASVTSEDEVDQLDWEFRRAAFRRAADIVRPEFQSKSWQAFWRTAVRNESIQQVASELELTVGAIYTTRSRILRRLKQTVRMLDLDAGDCLA